MQLEFTNFTFYVKTLSVTIGRRPPPLAPLPDAVTPGTPANLLAPPSASKRQSISGALGPADEPYFTSPRVSPRLMPVSATRSTSPNSPDKASLQILAKTEGEQPPVPSRTTHATGNSTLHSHSPTPDPSDAVQQPPTLETGRPEFHVDVDLGPIKAVSRDHARLFFDYASNGWALEVRGRNGVVIDGSWKAKGECALLGRRSVA